MSENINEGFEQITLNTTWLDVRLDNVIASIMNSEFDNTYNQIGLLGHESICDEWNLLIIETVDNIILTATDGEVSHTYQAVNNVWEPITDDTKDEFFENIVEMAEKAVWESVIYDPKFPSAEEEVRRLKELAEMVR